MALLNFSKYKELKNKKYEINKLFISFHLKILKYYKFIQNIELIIQLLINFKQFLRKKLIN